MKRYYCTYFNSSYLPTFLALYDSMLTYCGEFEVFCICMDDETVKMLEKLNLDKVRIVAIDKILEEDKELKNAQSNRTLTEFFFTCTPAITLYSLRQVPHHQFITYLDADLFFFNSPEPIFEELKKKNIGLIEHRFYGLNSHLKRYGIFNVGWMTFRNSEEGVACLENWRCQCIEWCYDRLEGGKFADQKYLDYWEDKGFGVHSIQHIGANVAPWNIGRYKVRKKNNQIYVNNEKIIFYHFAGFKYLGKESFRTTLGGYYVRLHGVLKNEVYGVYKETILRLSSKYGFAMRVYSKRTKKNNKVSDFIDSYSKIFRSWIFNDEI